MFFQKHSSLIKCMKKLPSHNPNTKIINGYGTGKRQTHICLNNTKTSIITSQTNIDAFELCRDSHIKNY